MRALIILIAMFSMSIASAQQGGFSYNSNTGVGTLNNVPYTEVGNFFEDFNNRQVHIEGPIHYFGINWLVEFHRDGGRWHEVAATIQSRNSRNIYGTAEWSFYFYQDDQGMYRVWSPDANGPNHWANRLSNSDFATLRAQTFRIAANGALGIENN